MQVAEALRRNMQLLQSLRSLLECAANTDQPEQILGSCVFLSEELLKEMEALSGTLSPQLAGDKAAND